MTDRELKKLERWARARVARRKRRMRGDVYMRHYGEPVVWHGELRAGAVAANTHRMAITLPRQYVIGGAA